MEMRDPLADNISLLDSLEAVSFHVAPSLLCRRFREVSSLATWLYCFLAYVAIITQDTTARDQLAYAKLMIRESPSHPGPWLAGV